MRSWVCSSTQSLIDVSPRSARAQIASAINIVIQVGRLADGRRRVLSLSELIGMAIHTSRQPMLMPRRSGLIPARS